MTVSGTINGLDLSYSDLEKMGWSPQLIEDYQSLKREMKPQSGTVADPNGVYVANQSGQYFRTDTPGLWFNPYAGSKTGWIQIV
jgi:hypothetical protein